MLLFLPMRLWPRTVAEGVVLTDRALSGLVRNLFTHQMNHSQIDSLAHQLFENRTVNRMLRARHRQSAAEPRRSRVASRNDISTIRTSYTQ